MISPHITAIVKVTNSCNMNCRYCFIEPAQIGLGQSQIIVPFGKIRLEPYCMAENHSRLTGTTAFR